MNFALRIVLILMLFQTGATAEGPQLELEKTGVIRETITADPPAAVAASSFAPETSGPSLAAAPESSPSYYYFGNSASSLPAIVPVPLCQSVLVINWQPSAAERQMLEPYDVFVTATETDRDGPWEWSLTVPISVATVKIKTPEWTDPTPAPRGFETPELGSSVHADGDACGPSTTIRFRFDLPGMYEVHLVPSAGTSAAPKFSYTVNAGVDFGTGALASCFTKKDAWVFWNASTALAPSIGENATPVSWQATTVAPASGDGFSFVDRLAAAVGGTAARPTSEGQLIDAVASKMKEGEALNIRLLGEGTSPGKRSESGALVVARAGNGLPIELDRDNALLRQFSKRFRGNSDVVFLGGSCTGASLSESSSDHSIRVMANFLSTEARNATVVGWNSPLGVPTTSERSAMVFMTYKSAKLNAAVGSPVVAQCDCAAKSPARDIARATAGTDLQKLYFDPKCTQAAARFSEDDVPPKALAAYPDLATDFMSACDAIASDKSPTLSSLADALYRKDGASCVAAAIPETMVECTASFPEIKDTARTAARSHP